METYVTSDQRYGISVDDKGVWLAERSSAGHQWPAPVQLGTLALYQLHDLIGADWPQIYFAAWPYWNAMRYLRSVTDSYGADSGYTVVSYFLSNARSWKGPIAKLVKSELKRRLASERIR